MGQLACWLGHLGIITLSLAMCAYSVSGVFPFISPSPQPCEVRPLLSLGSETGSGRADTLPKVTPVWNLNQALSDPRAQTPSHYSHCRLSSEPGPSCAGQQASREEPCMLLRTGDVPGSPRAGCCAGATSAPVGCYPALYGCSVSDFRQVT